MSLVRVAAVAVSADGFMAGPDQSLEHPMGVGAMVLHDWARATRTFRRMFGQEGGSIGLDDTWAARSFENVGAWILGRNMFGPVRGPWTADAWNGWWGDEPPYHVPVFVLTHHAREPVEMQGGTTFHFVTDGIEAALARAREAAGDRDVRIGGGAETIRQYLAANLIDQLHLAQVPALLGRGEPLFAGLDLPWLRYRVARSESSGSTTHLLIERHDRSVGT